MGIVLEEKGMGRSKDYSFGENTGGAIAAIDVKPSVNSELNFISVDHADHRGWVNGAVSQVTITAGAENGSIGWPSVTELASDRSHPGKYRH